MTDHADHRRRFWSPRCDYCDYNRAMTVLEYYVSHSHGSIRLALLCFDCVPRLWADHRNGLTYVVRKYDPLEPK